MIKGIYLREKPEMDKVDGYEILKEFDLNSEIESSEYKSNDYIMKSKEFVTDHYNILSFSIDNKKSLNTLKEIYKTIQKAEPGFLKILNYSEETIFIVFPKYEDLVQDETYKIMMEELVRFSAFMNKGDELFPEDKVKEYIKMCISYPGNRDNKIQQNSENND